MGVLSCFTGTLASLGQAMLQGAQVAQKAINDAGGILGGQLNLAHADTQCDEADSVPAIRQLLAAQNVVGIIGPETQEINAVAPIITAAKIPDEFQGGSTLFDHNTNKWLWRDSPSDSQLGVAMALYAHNKGYHNAALLFYSDIAAQTFAAPITATWQKMGNKIVSNITVAPDQTSYRAQVQQVINAHPDVIFTQTDAATAAVLFQNFKELNNLAIPFVGTDVTGVDQYLKAVTYAAANFWGLVLNPWAIWQYAHNMTGAGVTGAFVMMAMGAFYLLSKQHVEQAKIYLKVGVAAALIFVIPLIGPTGDGQGRNLAEHQPVTLAAMEALFESRQGAPLVIIGQPDVEKRRIDNPIVIPRILELPCLPRLGSPHEGAGCLSAVGVAG